MTMRRLSVKHQLFLILQVTYCVLPAWGLLYLGCFVDSSPRDLAVLGYADSSHNQPVKCISECSSRGHTYAGVQSSAECWCADSYGKYGQVADSECNSACPADGNLKCGGPSRNSVYRVDKAPMQYLGCYVDAANRDLPLEVISSSSTAPIACMDHCLSKGYVFAGMQVGHECYCGNSYGRHGQVADGECSRACSGNNNVFCGNDWRNSIYRVDSQFAKYKGCYKDEVPRVTWTHSFALDGSVSSPTTCVSECTQKGLPYAAAHDLQTCYCGLSYGRNGSAVTYKECSTFCDSSSPGCIASQPFAIYATGASTYPSKTVFYSPKPGKKALSGHVIDTIKYVTSVHMCISYCDVVTMCGSVNYDADGHVCELNSGIAIEASKLESRGGLVYYAPASVATLSFD